MLSITITDKSGAQRQMDFEQPELTIGRLENNDLVLPKTNVSKHHARLQYRDGRFVVADLQSTNGTYLNGRRITGPVAVRRGDKIYIGDFILGLSESTGPVEGQSAQATIATAPLTDADLAALPLRGSTDTDGPTRNFPMPHTEPPPPPAPAQRAAHSVPPTTPPPAMSSPPRPAFSPTNTVPAPPRVTFSSRPPRVEDPDSQRGPQTSPAVLTPSVRLQGALSTLMERLSEHMPIHEERERAFPTEMVGKLERLIAELSGQGVIGADLDRRFLTEAAISEAVGLGPLDRLLRNQAVREVVVDSPTRILADLGGGLAPVSSFFSSRHAVEATAKRLLSRAQVPVGSGEAITEALMPDGSHITVLSPPLTQGGIVFCVRCPQRLSVTAESLVTEGVMSADMLRTVRGAVRSRLNVLVTGIRGGGATRIIGALAGLAADHERIVSIERRPGLSISHPQVITLSRHAVPGLTVDAALEHAARLRFDRLVLDEVRSEDCLPVLMTASTTRGMIMGLRAQSADGALSQLQMFAGLSMGHGGEALHSLVAEAVQLVVHLHSEREGLRRIDTISEVALGPDGDVVMRPLHAFNGGFRRSEHRPSFPED